MPTAVFDFDGTLVYAPSSVYWTWGVPLWQKSTFPFLYVFEKLTGKSLYQKKAFEWLVGRDVTSALAKVRSLPPVPAGISKFKEFQNDGYKMVVMSYSPATFVKAWLDEKKLSAEVICPDVEVSSGLVKGLSEDWVTDTFTEKPRDAKKRVLSHKKINPDVCVGDNRSRDAVCDNYLDIRELQPNYRNKLLQILKMF